MINYKGATLNNGYRIDIFSRRFYCARIKVSREFITYSYCSNFDIPQTF